MKKKPKNWNKLSLDQQEAWLIERHMELSNALQANQKELAQVRGGLKIELSEDLSDRLDLQALKGK